MPANKPHNPLPEPHCGREPGTWAYKTVSTRMTNTARRVLAENDFPPYIQARLEALIADIPNTPIRPIDDPQAPDIAAWGQYIVPYLGQDWFRPPWFFVEHYFYRRILEATCYFQPGDGQAVDPFAYQKRMGLEVYRESIHQLMTRTQAWTQHPEGDPEKIKTLFYLDLWGNQADLSLWPAEDDEKPDHADLQKAQAHLLVDDAPAVAAHLLGLDPQQARVDILLDNAGFELVSDLALTDYLLSRGIVSRVCLHLKAHPTFVSDAMRKDVRWTITFLQAGPHPSTQSAGGRLQSHLEAGRLEMRENFYWTSPLAGWEMPNSLLQELSRSSLVISKGDANYRRLLGDRHWPFTTLFEDILAYYPAPLVALRTLKSELAVGLQTGQSEKVAAQDPHWLVNGRWGMVQFCSDSG